MRQEEREKVYLVHLQIVVITNELLLLLLSRIILWLLLSSCRMLLTDWIKCFQCLKLPPFQHYIHNTCIPVVYTYFWGTRRLYVMRYKTTIIETRKLKKDHKRTKENKDNYKDNSIKC